MERYVGLDAHPASCTFGVMGPSGKRLNRSTKSTSTSRSFFLAPAFDSSTTSLARQSFLATRL